ncbi:angiogenic factor with G patch and FHA domains 1 isoform X2 [Aethina tumida]|uniref:angiogenic factor with G patch and FHA domains 1 isoform X2 n=1 Tax=Aethina tumida TaxID=116153 RepID=UPI00096B24B9|nr:angiogenic factor with G patch and FHA domains 1 isoform X2 [Aethina tumida]
MEIEDTIENEGDISKDSTNKNSSKDKYELKQELKDKLQDLPEVLEFIELLQKYIEKQKRKLKRLKVKCKDSVQTRDVSVQTDSNHCDQLPVSELDVNNDKPDQKNVADDIIAAAEEAVQNSWFVYEETSGLYYDYSTGFYYNAEYGLYYDGKTGIYYKYDPEKQSYEFHSQVEIQEESRPKSIEKHNKRKNQIGKKSKVNISSGLDALLHSFNNMNISSLRQQALDVSKLWPPCMRIIIENTDVPKLKAGSLHIITFEGGTLGREGNHSIIIPDIAISKHHLKFTFDKETNQYLVTDLGSRNGTFLNGKRLSPSKQESNPVEIVHGSKLKLGATVFLCHIHVGNQTCGNCEPGLLQTEVPQRMYEISKKSDMHGELKNLRKKFGVANFGDFKLGTGYTDRAHKRRNEVGSQNPHEKTEVASLNQSISSQNKGFQLLSKMGWKEGESLGKDNGGIKEPVPLLTNQGLAGVGSTNLVEATNLPTATVSENKTMIWKKAQERFQSLPPTTANFNTDSD